MIAFCLRMCFYLLMTIEQDIVRFVNEPWLHGTVLLCWTALLAFFFAKLEIQIEGKAGWAANLPTWRIDKHPLLDVFWGGRALTGYHVWAFSFIILVFHLPLFMFGIFSLRHIARIFGCIMLFWVLEDFLWFVMNPAYGIKKFRSKHIEWHKRWFIGLPVDYWAFTAVSALFMWYSFSTP